MFETSDAGLLEIPLFDRVSSLYGEYSAYIAALLIRSLKVVAAPVLRLSYRGSMSSAAVMTICLFVVASATMPFAFHGWSQGLRIELRPYPGGSGAPASPIVQQWTM